MVLVQRTMEAGKYKYLWLARVSRCYSPHRKHHLHKVVFCSRRCSFFVSGEDALCCIYALPCLYKTTPPSFTRQTSKSINVNLIQMKHLKIMFNSISWHHVPVNLMLKINHNLCQLYRWRNKSKTRVRCAPPVWKSHRMGWFSFIKFSNYSLLVLIEDPTKNNFSFSILQCGPIVPPSHRDLSFSSPDFLSNSTGASRIQWPWYCMVSGSS